METLMGTRGRRFARVVRNAGPAEDGLALIEFALVLPIMIVMFVGMVEFGEAFSINRKVENVASTVADLVSQQAAVSDADLADIVRVGNQLMLPYRSAPLRVRIISVVADATNQAKTVAWSYGPGAPASGSAYTALPRSGLTEANSSLIVVESEYDFSPTLRNFLGNFEINGAAYFRPRLTRTVTKSD
jgi:Flp pilus assembly protein TadG